MKCTDIYQLKFDVLEQHILRNVTLNLNKSTTQPLTFNKLMDIYFSASLNIVESGRMTIGECIGILGIKLLEQDCKNVTNDSIRRINREVFIEGLTKFAKNNECQDTIQELKRGNFE